MTTRASRTELWGGAGAALALLLGYMLFWWNRGIQLNSNGLELLSTRAMRAGKMPYLDFAFWCPPMHLWVFSWMAAIFGDGMIYMRAFAVVERMAIFLLLYFWLARVFSPKAAFFGTVVAGVGFSSDVCDVLNHYDFESVLGTVAAGFAASVALSSSTRLGRWMFFVAGVCAGGAMLAKQTQGVGIFLVILAVLALGKRWRGAAEYAAGWTVPVGLTAWWLARGGAWPAFVEQNFLQGTSSKGSLAEILLRPVATLTYVHQLLVAFAVASGLIAAYWWLEGRKDEGTLDPRRGRSWLLWAGCGAALGLGIAWAWWLPGFGTAGPMPRLLGGISIVCIFVAMYGSLVLALYYTRDALLGRLDARGFQMWTLAAVSTTTAYMFSLSWTAYEKMLIPSFAFLMAIAVEGQLRRGWNWRGYAAVALGLTLICTATFRKLTWPYDWENWTDGPIKMETEETAFPEMKGLRVTKATAAFLNRVTSDIDAYSKPDEKIFCYPNYALLYTLSHRDPGVFAYMHWFDIASDKLAREEAARIREHPPAVMVFVNLPESVILDNERKFRGGKRSGQRDLAAAIQTMPGYRVVDEVPIPYMDYGVKIYARE
jgi:hypothetical protein